jgi:hypothetical protein
VKVKTFGDWKGAQQESTEFDFVAHCRGPLTGSFIYSLVMTDVSLERTKVTPLRFGSESEI